MLTIKSCSIPHKLVCLVVGKMTTKWVVRGVEIGVRRNVAGGVAMVLNFFESNPQRQREKN